MTHFLSQIWVNLNDSYWLGSPTHVPELDCKVIPRHDVFSTCQKLQRVDFCCHFTKIIVTFINLVFEKKLTVFATVHGCPQIIELDPSFCGPYSEDIICDRVQFGTGYLFSFFPVFFWLDFLYNKRALILLKAPKYSSFLIRRKDVLFVFCHLGLVYVGLMLDREDYLSVWCKRSLSV